MDRKATHSTPLQPAAIRSIRSKLIRWYEGAARDLPWRRSRDPYAIWISEIMLQQTRVAAVIPYYPRFLTRFPTPAALANAPEPELLSMWAGLGYYSRARNLQIAAREITANGAFPKDHAALLQLAGIGSYTAAAIASIAFGLAHAAVDGNVRRVVIRLTNDGQADIEHIADQLLDRSDPGRWNQAMMELGATICLPGEPLCDACPVARNCAAFLAGTQNQLPLKKIKPATERLERTLLIIRRNQRILLMPSKRVNGFWDLPEPHFFESTRSVTAGAVLGQFTHTITFRHYTFTVCEATVKKAIAKESILDARWFSENKLDEIPLSTTTKKALKIFRNSL